MGLLQFIFQHLRPKGDRRGQGQEFLHIRKGLRNCVSEGFRNGQVFRVSAVGVPAGGFKSIA